MKQRFGNELKKKNGVPIDFLNYNKFYSQNTNLLPPKPKSSFSHLKQGIQEFHRKYVLVQADIPENPRTENSTCTYQFFVYG